eukprot:TRINITY_DN51424_c0_g2_i1.p1 TRINITY_DN51424_c0_g2~~TRINITY_DN51424_c0_g2_i1.p1  ORF type:complete len:463 (-),score=84.58 TRINITY_DN51424_c0_g2_i1:9-1397(-)
MAMSSSPGRLQLLPRRGGWRVVPAAWSASAAHAFRLAHLRPSPRRCLATSTHVAGLTCCKLRSLPKPLWFQGAVRGAKILRWEADTPLAREMAAIEQADDFLAFCLLRADEFSRRDWLASLTLLTLRKRFSTSLPNFQRYSQRLLSEAEVHFEENVHLLLHRYGVLNYAPAIWKLLPLLAARIPLMTPKQLSLSAWGLGRTLVNHDATWAALGDALKSRYADFTLSDLSMYAWALSAVDRCSPAEVVAIKRGVREKLMGKELDDVSSHDLSMIFRSIAKLTPEDRRFHGWLLLLMADGMANRQVPFAAQGLTSVWATLAELKMKPDPDALEVLCEESRSLRMDHTFNQDMAADLARALLKLDVQDARPAYPIIDYVARRGLLLRADTLLTLVEFFAVRGVVHEVAWKRLGTRTQQRGVDLRLADMERLEAAYRKSGKGNERIYGMLDLFVRLREDQAKYGAA